MHKLFHLLAEVIYEDPQLHPHMTEEEVHKSRKKIKGPHLIKLCTGRLGQNFRSFLKSHRTLTMPLFGCC